LAHHETGEDFPQGRQGKKNKEKKMMKVMGWLIEKGISYYPVTQHDMPYEMKG